MVMRHIPPEDVPVHVRRLDGRLDELWIVEDCFYAGGVSQLTAVLAATTQSKIGHGTLPRRSAIRQHSLWSGPRSTASTPVA